MPPDQRGSLHVADYSGSTYTQAIAGLLNLMPRWYIGSVLRHVDFLASNVPGLPVRVYLGDARVGIQYAFGLGRRVR